MCLPLQIEGSVWESNMGQLSFCPPILHKICAQRLDYSSQNTQVIVINYFFLSTCKERRQQDLLKAMFLTSTNKRNRHWVEVAEQEKQMSIVDWTRLQLQTMYMAMHLIHTYHCNFTTKFSKLSLLHLLWKSTNTQKMTATIYSLQLFFLDAPVRMFIFGIDGFHAKTWAKVSLFLNSFLLLIASSWTLIFSFCKEEAYALGVVLVSVILPDA